jgi:hypothetical protein
MSKTNLLCIGVLICLGMLLCTKPACATSAQIELSEPVLPVTQGEINGSAFFGAAVGSDAYDTAGDLGATFPIGSMGSGQLYFFGDVFTWVEDIHGGKFQPRRIIYTLEPGCDYVLGKDEYRFFIKHQSFHDVDFFDDLEESYELYGINYRRLGSPEYVLRTGKYLNTNDVDYDWDFAAAATFGLARTQDSETYLRIWVHHVTENNDLIDRNGFTDFAGEVGTSYKNGITLFARYQLLHDIDRFGGRSEHQLLVGPKYVW